MERFGMNVGGFFLSTKWYDDTLKFLSPTRHFLATGLPATRKMWEL